ncbi:MAG: hypothetical protein Kow0047_21860 [Anaerolineae bacterium]
MDEAVIAQRVNLPCDVPLGGTAVVLVDGQVARHKPVQGAGRLSPEPWREEGRRVEALLFPATRLRMRFDVLGLRSAEGVRLDLTVRLTLHIVDPVRFLMDVVREIHPFTQADLSAALGDLVRAGLAPEVQRLSLEELHNDPHLRAWLAGAIQQALEDAELTARSGLRLEGLDAYDVRCQVWDDVQNARETFYLKASVAETEAAGRRLLDERVLAHLRQHLPIKEELIARKERLAELAEREQIADQRVERALSARRSELVGLFRRRAAPPSTLRPELWRRDLQEEVCTSPLADGQRLFMATRSGLVLALNAETGDLLWTQPARLGASAGDGMALAAGILWAPGHDGMLYGLDPDSGDLLTKIELGGRLSSAPLAVGDMLYISVDVDAEGLRPGAGQVVAVDASRAQIYRRWQVSRYGLRAQPTILDGILYVGDRRGDLYIVDTRRSQVEQIPLGGGRILGAALADEERSQIVVADSYGRVLALDTAGRERWSHRVGGPVVARPQLSRDGVIVAAGDGGVYVLDPGGDDVPRCLFTAGGPIATPPVEWRGLVFVGSNDGYLYALDLRTGGCFWQYCSGSPILLPPAVMPDGRLFVADAVGRVSALRWCLARYVDAARRLSAEDPPPWEEVAELWALAGEAQAALEAAEHAGRLDLVAEMAARLNWHEKAASAYEDLARRSRTPERAALWWAEAAAMWALAGQDERAFRCRLEDARARHAPLLTVQEAHLPVLVLGRRDVVRLRVVNETDVLARDVVMQYGGHVQRPGEIYLGALGPRESRTVDIDVIPSESGSATLRVSVRYKDEQGRPEPEARLQVRLEVAQPPVVHKHYYGPYVDGDGVIIMRGVEGGRGRTVQVHSGRDRGETPGI